jgi:hypothetical protein
MGLPSSAYLIRPSEFSFFIPRYCAMERILSLQLRNKPLYNAVQQQHPVPGQGAVLLGNDGQFGRAELG